MPFVLVWMFFVVVFFFERSNCSRRGPQRGVADEERIFLLLLSFSFVETAQTYPSVSHIFFPLLYNGMHMRHRAQLRVSKKLYQHGRILILFTDEIGRGSDFFFQLISHVLSLVEI